MWKINILNTELPQVRFCAPLYFRFHRNSFQDVLRWDKSLVDKVCAASRAIYVWFDDEWSVWNYRSIIYDWNDLVRWCLDTKLFDCFLRCKVRIIGHRSICPN